MTTLNKVNSQRKCSSTLFQVLAFGRKDEHDQSFQLTKNLLPYCQRFTFIHVHSPLNKILKSHFVGPQSTFKRSQNPFSWGLVEVLQVFLMNYWWMIPVSRDSPGNRTGFPHALRPRRRENFEAHGARHHAQARKTPWAPRQSFASKIRNSILCHVASFQFVLSGNWKVTTPSQCLLTGLAIMWEKYAIISWAAACSTS